MTSNQKRTKNGITNRVQGFLRNEDGSLIMFSLFLIVTMLIAVGVGVDTMRYEAKRTVYQGTADRAVLAAADLDVFNDPTRSAEDVVHDYFRRSGLPSTVANVTVVPGVNGHAVEVDTTVRTNTLLLQLIGVQSLEGPAPATATETVTDIEVALVLDNSGSMGSGTKMADLKEAASNFIDDVVNDDTGEGTVAVSVVPFATQVNPGDLGQYFTLSSEHAVSSCVTFDTAHFASTALSRTTPLTRTMHHDATNKIRPLVDYAVTCPPMAERSIMAWETDKQKLKEHINSMFPWGWTSIELGAKWGAAILDPASRTIVSERISAGLAPNDVAGMPFDYTRENTKKYLVIMSDGANTNQWDIKDPYRSGDSNVYQAGDDFYVFNSENGKYYDISNGGWLDDLSSVPSASQMEWPDVWGDMSVKYWAENLASVALGGTWESHYNAAVWKANSGVKNTRTSQICKAARDHHNVTIFTIGVGTYGQGDATLLDCAGGPDFAANFFDIGADEMDQAFSAIARHINQLRLTQ
ncbi:MAG: Tad domain-containing protein [Pseudomonadota bacterium]